MVRYAELHAHSAFSFLDGAAQPADLVETAARLGYTALAVTDHDGFSGAVKVMEGARRVGLPVVYGTEIGIDRGSYDGDGGDDPFDRVEVEPEKRRRGRNRLSHRSGPRAPADHLVLLAGSPEGYAALSALVSRGHMRGAKDRPRHRWADVAAVAARPDVVALSGCRQGAVARHALAGDGDGALREAARLREAFGDRLFLEVWHHALPEDDPRNDLVAEVGEALGIGLVATNQAHYADRGDADLAEVLAAIAGRRTLDASAGFAPPTDDRHLKAPAVMAARLRRYRGAVERAADLGEALAFDLRLVAPGLPDFPGPFGSEMEHLVHLTLAGARDVYPGDGPDGIDPVARARLDHELGIIDRLGFPGYFLVVKDIVDFARSRGIFCQIRGSGADSAVCRCLGLTRVDPVRLGLPFERFLSEERGRPPDIDLDLEADRREEVIRYCYRRYGRERAAMVANVITYRARSVLRDVGKAFGFTPSQVDGLSRFVDSRNPRDLRLEAPLPHGLTAELVYDVCARLDGFPRHLGIHSGGMVIADRPLPEVVPVEWGRMEGRSVIEWDKDDCAAIGIVKFDLLGLGMLNALHLAVDLVAEAHRLDLDLATIPQEPAIYRTLTVADTVGIFQVESRAQMATLPRMRPATFYDLAVEVALIRPGPIQGQSVHPYLRRRNGEEPVRYPHPAAEPILARTLGVPIFQEQLMELARVCAGFDGGQSDRLRQAMTHKRSDEEMAKLRDEVYAGMAATGITGPPADEIWEKLQGFAAFGFPESHSVSFAYIVYMSAWLRYHYPAEYLAGLLNAQPMGFYSPNTLIHDSARHGVVVRGPDVNASWHDATIEPLDADPDDVVTYLGGRWRRGRGPVEDPLRGAVAVRLGLSSVRNLGPAEITRIEVSRAEGGPFASGTDLARRTGLPVDALEGLAAAGALESLGIGRRAGMWAAGALAGMGPGRLPLAPGVEAPALPDMEPRERHLADLWSTGSSVDHPVAFVRDFLADDGCVTIAELLALRRYVGSVRVGGLVTHRQRPGTAGGVVFLNLEDETGLANVVVLPPVWASYRDVARRAVGLVVEGRVEFRDGVTNLVARRFEPLDFVAPRSRDFR